MTTRRERIYGLSTDGYAELLVAQGGVCAICHQPETKVNRVTGYQHALSVDHDHSTGLVRGLLCSACNRAIGLLSESPDRLRSAAEYLGTIGGP
jgi:hypothetical protein